jgi:hypothetical protein
MRSEFFDESGDEGAAASSGRRTYKTRHSSKTRTGFLLGQSVCQKALQQLVGVGSKTLLQIRRGLALTGRMKAPFDIGKTPGRASQTCGVHKE